MLTHLRSAWNQLSFKPWTTALALFALLAFTFGWFIPRLGFYWDDWPVIFIARMGGVEEYWHFYQYDRPFSAWTYVLTVPALGLKPLNWHIFTLILRWLTCVAMWWALKCLWPKRTQLVTWAALLFAVYPVFKQQSISVAYSQHWICYLLFFLSVGFMLQAQRVRHKFYFYWALTLLSILAFLLEILSMEYFAALELLRPWMLWYVAAEEDKSAASRAKTAFIGWLPYLAGLLGFLVWRFFFLELAAADANAPSLLAVILNSPGEGLQRLGQIVIQDSLFLFIRSWADLITLTGIDLTSRFLWFTWAASLLAAVGVFIYLSRFVKDPVRKPGQFSILLFGVVAAVFGILPVWATGRSVIEGLYANRFGLAAMFGCSIFLAALIEWLIADHRKQALVLSLLIGMTVGSHLQVANDYRWSWVSQTRFYWQLKWRAPQLQTNTAIFSEGEVLQYVGLYSTSFAVNMLYLPQLDGDQVPYWFHSLGREFPDRIGDFSDGLPATGGLRNYTFQGNTRGGITIQYDSSSGDCLAVLTPADANAPGLGKLTRQAVAASDLSRISPVSDILATLPVDIFGPEPSHGWCYLYQKASLAWQMQDWKAITIYADEALARGYHPDHGNNTALEWLPFIEGYARGDRLQDAQNLSLAVFENDRRIDARMCDLWKSIASSGDGGTDLSTTAEEVLSRLQCPN